MTSAPLPQTFNGGETCDYCGSEGPSLEFCYVCYKTSCVNPNKVCIKSGCNHCKEICQRMCGECSVMYDCEDHYAEHLIYDCQKPGCHFRSCKEISYADCTCGEHFHTPELYINHKNNNQMKCHTCSGHIDHCVKNYITCRCNRLFCNEGCFNQHYPGSCTGPER